VLSDVWAVLQEQEEFDQGLAALAGQVGASEFEVSAALKIFEREKKVAQVPAGERKYHLTLVPEPPSDRKLSEEALQLSQQLKEAYPVNAPVTVELDVLVRRTQLPEDRLKKGLAALEKAGALRVRRPFTGKVLRALERTSYSEVGLDLSRVREQERRALLLLKRMTDYAYTKRCRRSFLLRYFGEQHPGDNCGACDICAGTRLAELPQPTSSAVTPLRPSTLALETLRRWRRELSRDLGVPAFIIFNDATLEGLASALPIDREAFLEVKGTGESRWERFGVKVVEISLMARAAGDQPQPMTGFRKKARRSATG